MQDVESKGDDEMTGYTKEEWKQVDLPCPICERVAYFNDRTLRSHLEMFHRRVDIKELIALSKEMCGAIEEE